MRRILQLMANIVGLCLSFCCFTFFYYMSKGYYIYENSFPTAVAEILISGIGIFSATYVLFLQVKNWYKE